MKFSHRVTVTLWVNRLLGTLLLALAVGMPRLLDWYQRLRPLGLHAAAAIEIGFYCCAPAVALALWNLDKLLRNIRAAQVFTAGNVRCIRRVRWCCMAVGLICLPAGIFYPPLLFMTVIMAFLALVISVLSNVMAAAVAIREENDLTI